MSGRTYSTKELVEIAGSTKRIADYAMRGNAYIVPVGGAGTGSGSRYRWTAVDVLKVHALTQLSQLGKVHGEWVTDLMDKITADPASGAWVTWVEQVSVSVVCSESLLLELGFLEVAE